MCKGLKKATSRSTHPLCHNPSALNDGEKENLAIFPFRSISVSKYKPFTLYWPIWKPGNARSLQLQKTFVTDRNNYQTKAGWYEHNWPDTQNQKRTTDFNKTKQQKNIPKIVPTLLLTRFIKSLRAHTSRINLPPMPKVLGPPVPSPRQPKRQSASQKFSHTGAIAACDFSSFPHILHVFVDRT
jgi:hypothetical protein